MFKTFFLLWATITTVMSKGLKDYPQTNGMLVGAAVDASYLTQSQYASTIQQQYNLLVSENDFKWATIHPAQATYDFTKGDITATFARTNGMVMRGHNLLWAQYNPGWLTNGGFSATQLRSILIQHITTVVGHYHTNFPGLVIAWDVVNEIINAGTGVWAPLGTAFDVTLLALQTARAADPSAVLCMNEWGMENSAATTATYTLVKQLVAAGAPLDCVGMESHLQSSHIIPLTTYASSISAFTSLGLIVHITEFDCPTAPPTQYGNALTACVNNPKCKAFLTWGFTDKYTWLGTAAAPLPFDASYNPKLAYTTMLNILSSSPSPSPTPTPTPTPVPTPVPTPTPTPTPVPTPTPTPTPVPTPCNLCKIVLVHVTTNGGAPKTYNVSST